MDKVKINREKLVLKLYENRTRHIENYKNAMIGYNAALKQAITKIYNCIQNNQEFDHWAILNEIDKPKSYESDYDLYIAMFSNSVDENIELTQQEFQMLWMDKWNWSNTFMTTSLKYSTC